VGYNRYGKFNVQMLRVVNDSPKHEIHHFTCQMMLEGRSLETSFTKGDNSFVVPTETQKNTLYAMAKKFSVDPQEKWAVNVGKDFLSRHSHIDGIFVRIDRTPWERVKIGTKEHNHAFIKGSSGVRFTTMNMNRNGDLSLSSGFSDLSVLKSSQSGFEGYIVDEFTTLKPSKNRILATQFYCEWNFSKQAIVQFETIDFNNIFSIIQKIILEVFSGDPDKGEYSPSVQATVHTMASQILDKISVIEKISFKLPNIHFYKVDFNDFKTDMKNNNEVYFTFAGAHGQIEATFHRSHSKL